MNSNNFISDGELAKFGKIDTLSDKASALLEYQKLTWDLVLKNFKDLEQIKIKELEFDYNKVRIQCNPSRIASTSAKVDKKSIESRACFLCEENLPTVQKGIKYKDNYIILINPFPIFKQHLTIPHLQHIPQSIEKSFEDMLDLSLDLKDNFFVFYNGPKCGASAPDHLHFQAGLKNSTPIETEYKLLLEKFGNQLFNNNYSSVSLINGQISKLIYFESTNKSELIKLFSSVFLQLKKVNNSSEEPLINIISKFEEDSWKVFLYPREKHRPNQYFAEDESKIMISPAAVDIAGLCITPKEEDFNKINKLNLEDMFSQVLFDPQKQELFIRELSF